MIDVVGLVVVLVFYIVILVCGILATRWFKKHKLDGSMDGQEITMVAGRKIGGFVGVFTMTATIVGGGYINGTAESMAVSGIAWTLAPFGIFVGLVIGGLVFASKLHKMHYLTMFDPFQQKFGHVMVAFLYLAGICGDVFWSASILAALGTSLSVIISMNKALAIIISAVITVIYIMFGQMISVAYTDVIQLFLITVGLLLSLPFAVTNSAVDLSATAQETWTGTLSRRQGAAWVDLLIAMTFGTIPWQSYFQRVLSVKTARYAQILSIAGGCLAFLLAIPPALIGVVAVSADWNQTDYDMFDLNDDASLVLPLVLRHLTPRPVALIGLGAVAAAVMSSIDSAILASASVFTHNIYKMVLRKQASDRELLWTQRVCVFVVGVGTTILAIFVPSIYGMFILAADIVYVIMFPQLVSVLFVPVSNSYGSLFGFVIGAFLRLASGEPILGLPVLIPFPYYDEEADEQLFPFRTFAALCSFVAIVIISYFTHFLFTHQKLPSKCDFFGCYGNEQKNHTQVEYTSRAELLQCQETIYKPHETQELTTSNAPKTLSDDDSLAVKNGFRKMGATQNGYCVENYSKIIDTNCGPSQLFHDQIISTVKL